MSSFDNNSDKCFEDFFNIVFGEKENSTLGKLLNESIKERLKQYDENKKNGIPDPLDVFDGCKMFKDEHDLKTFISYKI